MTDRECWRGCGDSRPPCPWESGAAAVENTLGGPQKAGVESDGWGGPQKAGAESDGWGGPQKAGAEPDGWRGTLRNQGQSLTQPCLS